jgi:hypothetical protein
MVAVSGAVWNSANAWHHVQVADLLMIALSTLHVFLESIKLQQ